MMSVRGASVVAVLMMLTSAVALAQEQVQVQPKTPAAQPITPPTQPQDGQQPPAKPTWSVTCSNSGQGLDCQAFQSLFVQQTGQRVLTVAVRVPNDTKKPVMLIQLPLGIYLPGGAGIQFGRDQAKVVPLQTCDQNGCVAEYAITEAELAAMQKGADLTISMRNMKKEPVALTVPVLGFAAAYAKIK